MRGDGHAPEERRDVDEMSAAALEEVRHDGLHAVERGLHVDAHHLVEVVVREIEHAAADPAAGVVDPDVDAAEGAERFVAQALDVFAPGDVGDDGERVGRALSRHLAQQILAAGRERELVAVAAEAARDGRADPGAGAGDDDRLHAGAVSACAMPSGDWRTKSRRRMTLNVPSGRNRLQPEPGRAARPAPRSAAATSEWPAGP